MNKYEFSLQVNWHGFIRFAAEVHNNNFKFVQDDKSADFPFAPWWPDGKRPFTMNSLEVAVSYGIYNQEKIQALALEEIAKMKKLKKTFLHSKFSEYPIHDHRVQSIKHLGKDTDSVGEIFTYLNS